MKKLILGGFALVIIIVIAYFVYTLFFVKRASPPDFAEFSGQGIDIRIDYSAPYKKGRLIFGPESEGALQPYGIYWRLGANEATKITIDQPITIMGNKLERGSYSMYAIPEKDLWTLGFNRDADRWGISEPDYNEDVFRVYIVPQKAERVVEQMKIVIEKNDSHLADIVVRWDQVELRIPVDS